MATRPRSASPPAATPAARRTPAARAPKSSSAVRAVARPAVVGEQDLHAANDDDSISAELGRRIKVARGEQGLTLEELSRRSKVSRAMLSKVERGEKSPTLPIVVRIANGLGQPLSMLLGAAPSTAEVQVIRAAERLSFRDAETGFERWVLSPTHLSNGLEFVMHRIPPGRSTGTLPPYAAPTEKYIAVSEGQLTAYVDGRPYVLKAGDSMYFEVKSPYRLVNDDGHVACTYYMFIARQR